MNRSGEISFVQDPGLVPRDSSSRDLEEGTHEKEQLERNMGARHINMIAIDGMIGTGFFLSSGKTIAKAGPVGALLAHIFMGFITAGVSYATGETTAFMLADSFVMLLLLSSQHWVRLLDGTSVLEYFCHSGCLDHYSSKCDRMFEFLWSSIIWRGKIKLSYIVSQFAYKTYKSSEVVFAPMQIALILGLILAELAVDLGGGPPGDRIEFRYWRNQGASNSYLVDGSTGKFLAFWSSLISAAFSYGNVQVVALSGTEIQNPRGNIPRATKNKLQTSSGTAQQSPFVIAFQEAGIRALPSIISAVVTTSDINSGSACIFVASRTLYGLSADGHAPKIFLQYHRWGNPF
ncbi:related to general amino acid permease [Rhynchosporium agropyri]|uniref:Related to general amino acid permease n=1 Tax=Rhynchosporium agropyri TaxID=914238 RepID=A0A1E1K7Y6_9HELO|nr:related to general amino acid permease [Rhynchosporium agropyri]